MNHLEPDLVLRELLQRQVSEPGVLESADAVLGPCPQSVPDFQLGQPPTTGVGGEYGDPPAALIGDAQLGTGGDALGGR